MTADAVSEGWRGAKNSIQHSKHLEWIAAFSVEIAERGKNMKSLSLSLSFRLKKSEYRTGHFVPKKKKKNVPINSGPGTGGKIYGRLDKGDCHSDLIQSREEREIDRPITFNKMHDSERLISEHERGTSRERMERNKVE